MTKTKIKSALILTSTYPRWSNDSTPSFVADFAEHIAQQIDSVHILAPHHHRAKTHETHNNVHIKRIRYFTPHGETIFYGGGGITKIKKTPLYALKLLCYLTSLFFNTLFIAIRHDVAIINAHWIVPQGFIAILVKLIVGKPVAVTVHGADALSLNGRYMKKIKRFILRNADIVYVNSSVTKAACEKIFTRSYLLIPMGVHLHTFQSSKPSREIREHLKLGRFTILFVGRLVSTKGIIYLLETVKNLRDSKRLAKTIIIGSGPLEKELKHYVRENKLENEVIFTGWIDHNQLPKYYGTADIFVGPSLYEAQGLTFIEALAAGLPVIATNVGGSKDFIQNNRNGYLIKPKTSQQIFEKIAYLYDNPKLLKELKKHAASSVSETFTWDKVAGDYLRSWNNL